MRYIELAKVTNFINLYRTLKTASIQYYIDKGKLPRSIGALVRGGYLPPVKARLGRIITSPWGTNISITRRSRDFPGTPTVEVEHLRLVLKLKKNGKQVVPDSSILSIDKRLDDGDPRRGKVYRRSRRYLWILMIGLY